MFPKLPSVAQFLAAGERTGHLIWARFRGIPCDRKDWAQGQPHTRNAILGGLDTVARPIRRVARPDFAMSKRVRETWIWLARAQAKLGQADATAATAKASAAVSAASPGDKIRADQAAIAAWAAAMAKGDPKGAIVAIRDCQTCKVERPRPRSEPVTRPLRRRLAPMWHRTTGLCRSRVGVE